MDFADPTWTVFGHFRTLFGRPRRRHCIRDVAKYWMDQFSAPGVTSEAPKHMFFICYLGVTDYSISGMDFADGLWRFSGHFRALFGRQRYRHCVRFVALYWMDQFSAPDVNCKAPNTFFICTCNLLYLILHHIILHYIS